MTVTYDLIVIGSGPGGYVAAIRAAQLGLKTAIIEREHLGGICLNWGCIPTKALLRSAEIKHQIDNAQKYGLKLNGSVEADMEAVVARSRGISRKLNAGVGFLMQKNKIDVIWGQACLDGVDAQTGIVTVEVKEPVKPARQPQNPLPKTSLGKGHYQARHVIIATGARPRALPGIEPDGTLIWSYFEAMMPRSLPKSLLVMGSGAIGVEFASFYQDMGTQVTIIEVMDQILPVEDGEIAGFARKQLEKRGVKILTSAKVAKIEKGAENITATIEVGGCVKTLTAERLISAVGVVGNIENLGLEKLAIKTERGCIVTNEWSATNIKGIYAIGDVAGAPMLAHKAEEEGVICVEKIAACQGVHPLDRAKIPGCTYATPQVASVGLTEKKAREEGRKIRVGRYAFAANGKAIALGEDQGMVKVIFDETSGELLGAHMVGAEVTELIQGFVVAMNLETTEAELMHTIFPHPTLSEMMKESVLDAYGRALNA